MLGLLKITKATTHLTFVQNMSNARAATGNAIIAARAPGQLPNSLTLLAPYLRSYWGGNGVLLAFSILLVSASIALFNFSRSS